MILAPRWVLSAQAIDAAGSPHLQPGVHLRILPNPRFGFPMAPFMVYRANLGPDGRKFERRTDITWTTVDGRPLAPPVTVTPDQPVVGWLPPRSTAGSCIWVNVLAKPEQEAVGRPDLTLTRPQVRELPERLSELLTGRLIDRLPQIVVPGLRSYALKVEAQVSGGRGPATVASRSQPPYQLGASRIDRILVTGRGAIEGVEWIADVSLSQVHWDPWRLLALPLESGARYWGVPNADQEAKARVHRGAPLRLGLHDAPDAPGPAAAPAATPGDEWVRVSAAANEVLDFVKQVIDDTSAPQTELRLLRDVYQDGRRRGEVEVPVLPAMLHFGLDPGIGRLLGLVDVDEAPPAQPGDVLVYAVRALWSLDVPKQLLALLPPEAITQDPPRIVFDDRPVPAKLPGAAKGPYADLTAITAVTYGAPPDPPGEPDLGQPRNEHWLPADPPAAVRTVSVPVRETVPAAGLAAARRIKDRFEPLNREDAARRRQLIYLGLDGTEGSAEAGSGTLWDDEAPPDPFTYRVAQSDWFGRWSEWREAAVPDMQRPRPPQPVLQAGYTPPAVDDPDDDGPLRGTIRIEVPVPPPSSLAPGSRLLSRLALTVNGAASEHPLASPASPGPALVVSLQGPALPRAGTGTAVIRGRWIDQAGIAGEWSPPLELTLYDPRPARQLTFPNTLAYTSRPDVTGKARATLRWSPGPGHAGYRVYAADETGVRALLEAIAADPADSDRAAAAALLDGLDDLPAPDRAARYRANRRLLRRGAFELLTGEPLAAVGPEMRYEHAVSGSLRVLMFYRVVPVTAAGVEADFETAPLLTFGVPNSGPPPEPEVTVRPVIDPAAPAPYKVAVSVRVPRGAVPAVRFRIRRSSVAVMEPLAMPVVATGEVPAPAPGADQAFEYVDEGPWEGIAPAMRLRPWVTYHYGVELQGPPEPGATGSDAAVRGEWSALSAVASVQLIPPGPPEPVTDLTVTDPGTAYRIRFRHPERLSGGAAGPYRVEIYRQPEGGRESLLATLQGDAAGEAGWFEYEDGAPERTGARYRVLVIDPIGRRSRPTAPAGV